MIGDAIGHRICMVKLDGFRLSHSSWDGHQSINRDSFFGMCGSLFWMNGHTPHTMHTMFWPCHCLGKSWSSMPAQRAGRRATRNLRKAPAHKVGRWRSMGWSWLDDGYCGVITIYIIYMYILLLSWSIAMVVINSHGYCMLLSHHYYHGCYCYYGLPKAMQQRWVLAG